MSNVETTERNLLLLERTKEKGYFIRCIYVLTANPAISINELRQELPRFSIDAISLPPCRSNHWHISAALFTALKRYLARGLSLSFVRMFWGSRIWLHSLLFPLLHLNQIVDIVAPNFLIGGYDVIHTSG